MRGGLIVEITDLHAADIDVGVDDVVTVTVAVDEDTVGGLLTFASVGHSLGHDETVNEYRCTGHWVRSGIAFDLRFVAKPFFPINLDGKSYKKN